MRGIIIKKYIAVQRIFTSTLLYNDISEMGSTEDLESGGAERKEPTGDTKIGSDRKMYMEASRGPGYRGYGGSDATEHGFRGHSWAEVTGRGSRGHGGSDLRGHSDGSEIDTEDELEMARQQVTLRLEYLPYSMICNIHDKAPSYQIANPGHLIGIPLFQS